MKILITGAKGFIGKNLIAELRNRGYVNIYEYDTDTKEELLDEYSSKCDFVFNLAGINRPKKENEFMEGNVGFVSLLLESLKRHGNTCPIMNSSSIHAALDNAYGRSKKAGEELLFAYGKKVGSSIYMYRLTNVFGKWCRPNYNSAIATFCYNAAHELPLKINDRETELQLAYIDDVVEEMIAALEGHPHIDSNGFCYIPTIHKEKVGEIADLIVSFKECRDNLMIPDMTNGSFSKKLYSTFLSYLPVNKFSYPLKMNCDERGSFTEILKTLDRGQVSVNISKPGVTKGNHWHHTKNEKFIVVSGYGMIRFRRIGINELVEYHVSGDNIEVIDIPVGYIHEIINLGNSDLVTIIWSNECFDPNHPDTFHERVERDK